ncbi:MAG: hypothetical protein COB36_01715 [Alphaproteobacteria bacterium]|nr:MAG: hypothetical protein COB36_01715 [Alphaproteobacteria bacterium]
MRYILFMLLFCTIPFAPAYANQQVADAVKALKIGGVNVFSSMDQAQSMMTSHGYSETHSSPRGTLYNKGNCRFEFGKMMSTSMMKYACNSSSDAIHDNNILKTLETLCAIKDNGNKNKNGCLPKGARATPSFNEMFVVIVENDHKYTVTIRMNHNTDGTQNLYLTLVVMRLTK